MIKLLSYLPLWLLYALSEIAAFGAYHVFRYRKTVVFENISTAFPKKEKREIRIIAKRFYRQFGHVIVETIRAYHFKKSDWEKRACLKNPEVLSDYLDQGVPVVIMSGHTANWEWPAFSIGQQLGYGMEFLYKPINNGPLDQTILKFRTKHGGVAIPKDSAMREIIKRRKQPRLIGIIGDQLPALGTEKLWFDFLNRETAFYVGAERIATLTNYAVFYVDTERVGLGKYEVTFKPIASPPYEKGQSGIIEKFVELLQASIHKNPSDYLWSHKRWKYSKAGEEAFLKSL